LDSFISIGNDLLMRASLIRWYDGIMSNVKNPIPSELWEEWHPMKNGDLRPENLTAGSNRKVWWVCRKGHEWQAVVSNRTYRTGLCPYCTNKRPIVGETDLATTHPMVIEWWSSNNEKFPQNYVAGSAVKILWLCPNEHEFILPIRDFLANERLCGACHLSLNNLLTLSADILDTWDHVTNKVLPSEVYIGSHVKYFWRCAMGHQWASSVSSRVKIQQCPVCSGLNLVSGINDLATKYPILAEKWHSTKNDNLLPSEIKSRGAKQYYWKQSCGHIGKAHIAEMLAKPNRCGYCTNQKIMKGYNDLATTNPRLASEWHTTKNGNLQPTGVPAGTQKIVWWKCREEHEWQASVLNRTKGDNCPYCGNKKVLAGFNDLQTLRPEIASQWSSKNTLTPQQVSSKAGLLVTWVCEKAHEWKAIIGNRTGVNNTGCPDCWAASFVSKPEQAIYDYLTSLGLESEQSNRKILGKRQELDIYIPSKNVAIEFNGLYWHSEAQGKDETYHRNKWLACKDNGIQLIQVWEDEWTRNPEQVKRMLAHKLGVSSERKVFARKTTVAPISKLEVEVFLNENHVQGFASGSYYLGLREKVSDELIAVLVLKKESGTSGKVLNIIRYATSANVVGGFTKLLSYAEKTYKPEAFITFADHGVSDGGLYENNGFIADKELAPDYMYVVGGERKHKFGYRLKRFQNDPDLLWEEGLTERQLAALNGLERIWDSGKTRYRKTT
jgi:hypothetical protein